MTAPSPMISTGTSVFYPDSAQAATNLKHATLFTRICVLTTSESLRVALDESPQIKNTYCLAHYNDILIFDSVDDEHMTHTRAVLEILQTKDMNASLPRCAFQKPTWAEAGFYVQALGAGEKQAFMVLLREHIAPEALE